MQAHKEVTLAKIVSFTLLIKSFPYCCLLIIASIIHNVQFSRCIFESLRDSMKSQVLLGFQSISFSISFCWSGGPKWTRSPAGEPRRLQVSTGHLPRAAFRVPRDASLQLTSFLALVRFFEVVGQNGLEPSTSRLSVVCSSQLSYWPISASLHF